MNRVLSQKITAVSLAVSGLLLSPFAFAAGDKGGNLPIPPLSADATPAQNTPTLGSTFGGGIVFYVDRSGHGLIAATVDQGQGTWNSASALCTNYRGGGFADWRLPSKDELHKIYLQKNLVPGVSSKISYWCSQSKNANYAYDHMFLNSGIEGYSMKGNHQSIRAVRSF
jgi:hypothetical protein